MPIAEEKKACIPDNVLFILITAPPVPSATTHDIPEVVSLCRYFLCRLLIFP